MQSHVALALHTSSKCDLEATLRGGCYYAHFPDEKTEAAQSVNWLKSHSQVPGSCLSPSTLYMLTGYTFSSFHVLVMLKPLFYMPVSPLICIPRPKAGQGRGLTLASPKTGTTAVVQPPSSLPVSQ